ncbi:deubiquitinase OTU2 Ecym_4598 [Eremothecium cymbalariae DBVPG|uniref:OTU domain-containing protein n=1 Tax=Eremothecium cymbalariae (strain CBS 270.75 / DBVPG 7215 / KCTC 17166 / NRRL Y-17582) TaxID=931890 RepID=G8JSA8_ERECY|nr:hypothetical protein Ecym_4598 [Eremothecium cymbalariae DBVPG\
MEEEILSARHRKEKKDLQNQITGLKKQSTKRTRKQVNARCEELTSELEKRHVEELRQFRIAQGIEIAGDGDEQEEEVTPEKLLEQMSLEKNGNDEESVPKPLETEVESRPGKRMNRRKQRLAKAQRDADRIREEALAEAAMQPDLKGMEEEVLEKVCELNGLTQVEIQPDGNCLFAAILDQLRIRHNNIDGGVSYYYPESYEGPKCIDSLGISDLRSLSCCYVREHRDDFIPYLFEDNDTTTDIEVYTEKMETTATWGGEIELLALSHVFRCCISVMISGGSTLKINEHEMANAELKIIYYKHKYALGEHYNSLHDV